MLEFFLQHIWGFSFAGVVILSIVYVYFCARKICKLNDEIKKVLQAKDIAVALKNSELLKSVWKSFDKSLTKTSEAAYLTTDAIEFFTIQNLTRGMNMSFWQAYGGIFTGLGILGTFAGLTVGLQGVVIPKDDNISVLKDSIAQLLSGVETAFVTSLVGISCALFYSFILKWREDSRLSGDMNRLCKL